MYEAFYKLANDPFRLLPDPEICFPHRSCAKAWAYLRYALKRGEGIVVITGPPGSGKTTLAERLLNELNPSKTVSVKLIANDLNPTDLLRRLAYSFGIPAEGMDRAMLAHRIERYLIELEHGNRQALVLIDEAQTLSHQSLEAMRLLTDLQSRSRPVLQLFLLGQEDLEGVMSAPGMTQFQQRVIASCRLHRMDLAETKAYLEYRLGFADWAGDPSVNGPAVMAIFRASRGLPRHVNKICSRLLLHGCTEEKHALKQRDVMAVVKDLRDELLTPLEGEIESVVEMAGSTIGSIYELALVPTPRAAETKRASHDAMNALFLPEQPAAQTEAGYQAQDDVGRGAPGRRAGGRYFYRVGYRRPYRFRRWLHRSTQFPAMLAGQVSEWVRKWAPVLGDHLSRMGRASMANAVRLLGLMRRWIRGRTSMPGVLNERMGPLPNAAIAGLGGLLVVGLAFGTWSHGTDSQQQLADRKLMPQGAPFLVGETVPSRPTVLDGAPRYLDVTSIPPTQSAAIASLLNSSAALVQLRSRSDSFDHRSGLNDDAQQVLLGRVSDNAADRLVGQVAQAISTLDVWLLANKAPKARRGASQGAAPLLASGSVDASESRGQAIDQQVADENNILIVTDETGMSLDVVSILTPPAAGVSMSEEAASADTNVEASAAEQVSAAVTTVAVSPTEVGDDMVVLNVTAAPSSDQVGIYESAGWQRQVEQTLAQAEQAMEKDRLLMPADDSAYGYYQRVLEIDARNEDALAGLKRIGQRYRVLAKWALEKQFFDKAELYLGRGLRVDPDDPRLLALRGELNDAIAEVEAAELEAAKIARMAMEMAQAEPVVEREQPQETSLNKWMRSVDGL